MANTWNQSGTTWNTGRWGTTDAFTTGWGAQAWNDGEWGELKDQTVFLTGQSATLSVGSITAFPEQGWGRDTWNFEAWGISGLTVELTAPDAMTSNVGPSGWNGSAWGEDQGWGIFVLSPADVMGLTGVSSTASVGSITNIIDASFELSGQSATSSVGSLAPADVMGLSGVAATSSVGSILPADVVGISGVSATTSVGSIDIGSSPIILLTSPGAMTASRGAIDPQALIQGLVGVAATSAVGSLTPADVVGLTGVSATVSIAGFGTASGFGIQAYSDVDTGSNSSYTNVATGSNTSYTDAA